MKVVTELNQKAISALAEITGGPDHGGLGDAEIGAVKKLLNTTA